jgi:hypothetical protein
MTEYLCIVLVGGGFILWPHTGKARKDNEMKTCITKSETKRLIHNGCSTNYV